MARAAGFLFIASASIVLATVTCYAPTEVTLDITTDVACGEKTALSGIIYRGTPEKLGPDDDARTDPSKCVGRGEQINGKSINALGTLVITPSGDRDGRAAVKLVFARPGTTPEQCDARPGECIIARRAFSFLPHTSRRLPVHLSSDCFGLPCEENKSTCIAGKCVPIDVTCEGDDCNVLADGGADPPPVDAAPDVRPTDDVVVPSKCVLASKGVVASNPSLPKSVVTTATHVYWIVKDEQMVHRLDKATGEVQNVALPLGNAVDVIASDGAKAWLAFKRGPSLTFSTIVSFEDLTLAGGGRTLETNTALSALWVFPPNLTEQLFYFSQPQAMAGNGSNIHELKEPSGADVSRVVGVPSSQSLVVTSDRILSLNGSGLAVYVRSTGQVPPGLGTLSSIDAIAGDGTHAWIAGTNALSELVGNELKKLHSLPVSIKRFVFDDAFFYWVEGAPTVSRVPRLAAGSGTTTPQAIPISDANVAHVYLVAVDPSPQGCMYLWTEEANRSGFSLRVAAKP